MLPKNKLILDAGCGPGMASYFFSKHGYRSVSVDYSPAMIKVAKERVPKGEFYVMDLRRLKFPAGRFGGVWCSGVLVHLNMKGICKALDEFHRVLKPHGALFISVEEGHGAKLEPILGGGRGVINYFSKDEYVEMLQSRGFRVLSTEEYKDLLRRNIDWLQIFAERSVK